jgi:phospholipase A1/A2
MPKAIAIACILFLASTGAGAGTLDEPAVLEVMPAPGAVSAGELLQLCRDLIEDSIADEASSPAGVMVGQCMDLGRYTRATPYVLTAHRPNYILPAVYIRNVRQSVADDIDDDLQDIEVQFQLSLKVLLVEEIYRGRGLASVAYTNRSYWQAYNSDISTAFRETNHEPELILTLESDRRLLGFRNTAAHIIFNHQSNGGYGDRSRSWNRLMLHMILERGNLIVSFKPWYRIPEESKSEPDDPTGDDNPDIRRYMGNFELSGAWMWRRHLLSVMLRNNLRTTNNYGAIEISWSYPLNNRIKGVIKAFHGHGESLISYNQRTTSVGAGFMISDWL